MDLFNKNQCHKINSMDHRRVHEQWRIYGGGGGGVPKSQKKNLKMPNFKHNSNIKILVCLFNKAGVPKLFSAMPFFGLNLATVPCCE
jgi:hypothetical protein